MATTTQLEMFDEELMFPDITYVEFDDYQEAILNFYEAANEIREQVKQQELHAAFDRAKYVR